LPSVTRKSRNNTAARLSGPYCLPKTAVLRGRDHFNRLFERPDKIFSEKHLLLRFYTDTAQEADCKMGFIAAKKLGKANERNYLKRLLREAYRLHRHLLMDAIEMAPCKFYGALTGRTVAVDFETIEN